MSNKLITHQYRDFSYYLYRGIDEYLLDKLDRSFRILPDDRDDVASPTQLSKFEIRKNYAYFALQLAEYDAKKDMIFTEQVHCFVSDKFVFLIDEDRFNGIQSFHKVHEHLVKKEGYNSFDIFYEFLDMSVIGMFRILDVITARVKNLESSIFEHSLGNDQIAEIQDIKKNIVNFKSILTPLYDMFDDLTRKYTNLIDETGREAIDDSLDKIKKLINRLDNFREIMKLLTETNEMFMARSTNQTVRRLTLLNVLLLAPGFIAALFGMNVHF